MPRDTRPSSVFRYLARPQLQAVALLLMVSVSAPVHAEIYKWTDKNGGQHYSEQPPAGVKYEKVAPRYAAPPATPPAAQPQSEPQNAQQKAVQERQQQEKQHKEEVAKVRQQNCENFKGLLSDLQSSPRINIKHPDGTLQRLSEEELQVKIAETQELVKKYCD